MSVLTLFSSNDLDELFLIQSEIELAKLRQAIGIPESISDVKAWLKRRADRQSPRDFILAVRDKSDGLLVGYVTLISHSKKSTAELGIVIGNRNGSGLGSKALLALEKLAEENFGFEHFLVIVLIENLKAQSFFRKNGYLPLEYSRDTLTMLKTL